MNLNARRRLIGSILAMCVLMMLASIGGDWGNTYAQTGGPKPGKGKGQPPTAVPCKPPAYPGPGTPVPTPRNGPPCGAPPPAGPPCERLGGNGQGNNQNVPPPCREAQPSSSGAQADAPAPNTDGVALTTDGTTRQAAVVQTTPIGAPSKDFLTRMRGWWSAVVSSLW